MARIITTYLAPETTTTNPQKNNKMNTTATTPKAAAKKANLEILDTQISKGRQDWNFTQYLNMEGNKLRISIKRDSYDDQSYIKIELHNGGEWKYLYSIDRQQAQTLKNVSAHQGHPARATDFETDSRKLIDMAKKLLA